MKQGLFIITSALAALLLAALPVAAQDNNGSSDGNSAAQPAAAAAVQPAAQQQTVAAAPDEPTASANSQAEPQPDARSRDRDGRRLRDAAGRPPQWPSRRWMQDFESQYDQDIQWLRERGLKRYADRLEEMQKSDDHNSKMAVFSSHVHVRQLRRLWKERPEEAQRAVDEMRLGFEILDLAGEARKAEGEQKERLAQKLKEALDRQFEARLAAQRSLLAAMQRRLERMRKEISRQEKLKAEIVEQRQKDLLDPEKPLLDYSQLMPGGAPPPAGSASPGERGDKPAPESQRDNKDEPQADGANAGEACSRDTGNGGNPAD